MDLKISSYNAHSCVGNDGIYSVDRIARVIRDGGAEIVCLKVIELNDSPLQTRTRAWSTRHNDDQPSMIAKLTGLQYHVFAPAIRIRASSRYKECQDAVTANDVSGNFNDDEWKRRYNSDTSNTQNRNDMGKFGIAILSRYPIVSIRIHQYKRYKKKTIRNCMACLILLPNDTRLWVVNTHLGCHFIGNEQHQQSKELVSFVKSLETSNAKIAGVVVCGDMNSPPIYQSINTIVRSGMLDTWKLNGQGCSGTFPSNITLLCFRKMIRLDYIFMRGRRILCKLVYVQDDNSTHLASDHLPLFAVFVVGD